MTAPMYALLCSLAAAIFSAHIAAPRQALWSVIGLLIAVLLFSPFTPLPSFVPLPYSTPLIAVLPSQTALLMALASAWLLRKPSIRVALVLGGLLTALWIDALALSGVPYIAAVFVAIAFVLLTLVLACKRAGFVSAALLSEAKVLLLLIALAGALLPEIIAGWRSASALQDLDADAATDPMTYNSVLFAAFCVLLGIVYKKWRYR